MLGNLELELEHISDSADNPTTTQGRATRRLGFGVFLDSLCPCLRSGDAKPSSGSSPAKRDTVSGPAVARCNLRVRTARKPVAPKGAGHAHRQPLQG